MAKRAAASGTEVDNVQQAEGALAEMAALERKIALSRLAMQESIDMAKERAREECAPLETRLKELHGAVKKWATMKKSELFAHKRSLDLAFGVVGFQAATKIQQMDNVSVEETLRKIRDYGFTGGLRIIEELDRERVEKWTDERLALVGLRRRATDTYYCKINQEKLEPR